MSIEVRYFASLREKLGKAGDSIDAGNMQTVTDVWDAATGNTDMPANTLCAINMEYVTPEHTVVDGDEVAFFPPVTGG